MNNAIPDSVLRGLALGGKVRGAIPAVDVDLDNQQTTVRLIPWNESSLRGQGKGKVWAKHVHEEQEVPRDVVARMQASLPPGIRRTPQEKLHALITRLVDDGMKLYKAHGYVKWPASIQQELYILGWKDGDPNFWGQVEALARKFIVKAANQQRESDAHKVTLDYHGKLSA